MIGMALCSFSASVSGQNGIKDPVGVKQEREAVRKQLQDVTKAITETSSEKKKVSRAISTLDKRMEQTRQRLVQLDQDRTQLENDIAQMRMQEVQLAQALEETGQRLGAVMRNQYRRIENNPTQAWLAGQSASQAARESYWFERISSAERDLAAQQAAQARELQAIRLGLEKKAEKLVQTIAIQHQNQREIAAQREEREQLVADLNSKLKDQQLEKVRLQRDDQRLTTVIAQLTKAIEEARKRQAQEKGQAQRGSSGSQSSRKGATSVAPPMPSMGEFGKLKGNLVLPTQGTVMGQFGKTRSKDGQGPAWKGLFIATDAGNPVRAISAGRIVFSEWLRGFGEIVIIDHGDQYLSVYGNNSKLLKTAGDVVKAGDPIAETGNSSGNLETGLYFELRYQGQPFDPISWTKGH